MTANHRPADTEPFHLALQRHRKARGFSLNDVARRCGVSTGVVEDWEADRGVPAELEWTKLCASCFNQLRSYAHFVRQHRDEIATALEREREEARATVPSAAAAPKPTLDDLGRQYAQLLADASRAQSAVVTARDGIAAARAESQRMVEAALQTFERAQAEAAKLVSAAEGRARDARTAADEARELAETALAELQQAASEAP